MNNEIAFTLVFTILIILVLLAGVVFSVFMYRKQKLQQKLILQQQELEYEQELRLAEAAIGETLMEHVSRELHDNIGQLLTVINLQVEMQKLEHPANQNIFSSFEKTIAEAHYHVRSLSRTLNTDFILRNGIISALQLEIERLRQLRQMEIVWNYDDEAPELSKDQQLMTFRIFQEIISNILKGTDAKKLEISLTGGSFFRLQVLEDRNGTATQEQYPNESALKNMMHRAKLAEMLCKIDVVPGKGTSYTLTQKEQVI